jgi:uncharacterized membrane protein YgdD (TMEM256/DUF423 family)
LKKPRSPVESCCPYGSMVPRFTVKVEAVHFVETAALFCRMHCVTLQHVATVSVRVTARIISNLAAASLLVLCVSTICFTDDDVTSETN